MFQNISLFRTANAMATHAASRQSVIAKNIANVDTPNFKARDITPFRQELGNGANPLEMVKTRSGHIQGESGARGVAHLVTASSEATPNGNTVSIEAEMLKSIEAEQQHSRALAIYQSSLDLIKISIGRGR